MNMKNNIKFSLLLVASIFLVSCETEGDSLVVEDDSTSSNLLNYRTMFRMDKPIGSIALQSNATGQGLETRKKISLSKKEGDNTKSLQLQSENKIITNFNQEYANELSNLFGNDLLISYEGERSPPDSLYVPEELIVNFNSSNLEVGTTVNWNMDSQNENGLLVFVSYNPLLQPNVNLAIQNQYFVEEVFALNEGTGSYTITQSDIDRFPEDASLQFRIMRGVYSKDSNGEPAFVAFSMVSNVLQVKK